MDGDLCFMVCENHLSELAAVLESEKLQEVQVVSFPGHCGHPPLSWTMIEKALPAAENKTPHVVISGGCCLGRLGTPPDNLSHCRLIKTASCFELFAGKKLIEKYLKEGAYLITPGWLKNWRNHLDRWGFNQQTGLEFFKEFSKKLVLLDTVTEPDTSRHIKEMADFLKLPFEILPVGLDHFRLRVLNHALIRQIEKKQLEKKALISDTNRQMADYNMTFDLISNLSHTIAEKDAIENIFKLFTMLFSPDQLNYLPVVGKETGEIKSSCQWAFQTEPFMVIKTEPHRFIL